jgi:nicotinamide-nucleotide amidase
VAESCSGGLLAERISAVPGASAYFRGGVVAYANAAKIALLDVPAALLESHGAVSEPVARAMAQGVRKRFDADFGVATTGISGPTGGTPDKPVGLVFVARSHGEEIHVEEVVLPFDRERHRRLTAQIALDAVRRTLLGVPPLALRYGRRGGG